MKTQIDERDRTNPAIEETLYKAKKKIRIHNYTPLLYSQKN